MVSNTSELLTRLTTLDFKQAEDQFDAIIALDPMRLDDIDILSNILYVSNDKSKLSRLAHHFLGVDRERPEVCCMIGNYYSLRQEPERAIQYFRRAAELDQTYLPAWTLMGHEFVEIKNSHAAIESYRRAIGVQYISLYKNGCDRLLFRRQQERLQSVVRPRSSL